MRISLPQLEALYWTSRLGSVRAAARYLNLTQPALSARIRELERHLGAALFDRSGHRMRLTSHGAIIMRQAERILALAGEIEAYGRDEAPRRSLLRIGAADIFAMACLPELLRVLESRYPNLIAEVSVAFSHSLNRMLLDGTLDIAFLTDPEVIEAIRTEPLGNVELVWMAPSQFRFAKRVVRPKDLVEHHVITNPAPSHLYRSVHRWFEADGERPSRVSTCDNLSIITRLVARGFGVALLPLSMQSSEPEAGLLRPLRAEPAIAAHEMRVAYPADRDGPEIVAVLTQAREILSRTHLLAPL